MSYVYQDAQNIADYAAHPNIETPRMRGEQVMHWWRQVDRLLADLQAARKAQPAPATTAEPQP